MVKGGMALSESIHRLLWILMMIDSSLTERLTMQMKATAAAYSGNNSSEISICTAPGRVDVIGGLSLEAGGVVAQMALPNRAGVALQWRNDGKLLLMGRQHRQRYQPVILPAADILSPSGVTSPAVLPAVQDPQSSWAAPLISIFQHFSAAIRDGSLKAMGHALGATVVVDSDIRAGSGQAAATASSAALLQAISQTFNHTLSALEKAHIISNAQRVAPGHHGHVVDALTVLSAQDGPPAHLLRYSAQPHSLLGQIPLSRDIRIMALDTGVTCADDRNIFAEFHLAGAMGAKIIETIYRDLGQRHNPIHGYLGNVSPELYRRYFRAMLPRRVRGSDFLRTYGPLDPADGKVISDKMYAIRTTLDHLISEYEHAEHFLQAMEELSESPPEHAISAQRRLIMQRAGRLMLASHHSYRLRLQLSCPQADWLIDRLTGADPHAGAYGARITDCGGGGTVAVFMDTSERATDALLAVISEYKKEMGLDMDVRQAGEPGSAGALI
jgi:galactokinase